MSSGHSRTRIALHWLVAGLVLVQFLDDGAIGSAWRAIRRGAETVPGGLLVTAHIVAGISVLAFALWRIALRFRSGAPPPPSEEPRALRIVAAATHGALYLLLLVVPLSGLAAWYGGVAKAGDIHELLTTLLMWLIFLHIAGALYQHFILRSQVVVRMLRPAPR